MRHGLVFRPVQSHRDVFCRKDLVTSWDVTRDLCPGPARVCTPPWESPGTHGGAVGDGLTAGIRELRKGVLTVHCFEEVKAGVQAASHMTGSGHSRE